MPNAKISTNSPSTARTVIENSDVIVIKIGSSLLIDKDSLTLNEAWLRALIDDIAVWQKGGKKVIIVSSGATALGKKVVWDDQGTRRPIPFEDKRAASAVGQFYLVHAYHSEFKRHNLICAQMLFTLEDTETRKRYVNVRMTLEKLLEANVIPVINENDPVAISEYRYGDNDRLSARIAGTINADCLILLSDVDGLYTDNPHLNPDSAEHIPYIPEITPQIEDMAGSAVSGVGTGGMHTKIMAARIAMQAGCHMLLGDGRSCNALSRMERLENKSSVFAAAALPASRKRSLARKIWLASNLSPVGTIYIDDGARNAIRSGKSLLPSGIRKVEGDFSRGDCVQILLIGEDIKVAQGICGYNAREIFHIMGRNSRDIPLLLGYKGPSAVVHHNDMYCF